MKGEIANGNLSFLYILTCQLFDVSGCTVSTLPAFPTVPFFNLYIFPCSQKLSSHALKFMSISA